MKTHKVIYEPVDDVLNIWLSKKPIDYAEDEDGVIVHYTKNDEPVYIEILNATKFASKNKQVEPQRQKTASIAHRVR